MIKIINGQRLLILCCIFYLIWWYRGFRPGVTVSRIGGINGILLLITAALGIAGIVYSCMPVLPLKEYPISLMSIVMTGILSYFVLLFVTRGIFHRVVTTELLLIVGWTTLEMTVADKLYADGTLLFNRFVAAVVAIVIAFSISIVLYVAYYRMEEMQAFKAAMIPLVTEALTMGFLIGMALYL